MKDNQAMVEALARKVRELALPLRLSPDVLRFDSPGRPLPSPEDEVRFWEDEVEPRRHVLLAIEPVGGAGPGLLGFLSFFARDAAACETASRSGSRRERHGVESPRRALPANCHGGAGRSRGGGSGACG